MSLRYRNRLNNARVCQPCRRDTQALAKCFITTYALLVEFKHHMLFIFPIKILIETIKNILMAITLYYLTQHLIFITQSSLSNSHYHHQHNAIIYHECLEHC